MFTDKTQKVVKTKLPPEKRYMISRFLKIFGEFLKKKCACAKMEVKVARVADSGA